MFKRCRKLSIRNMLQDLESQLKANKCFPHIKQTPIIQSTRCVRNKAADILTLYKNIESDNTYLHLHPNVVSASLLQLLQLLLISRRHV